MVSNQNNRTLLGRFLMRAALAAVLSAIAACGSVKDEAMQPAGDAAASDELWAAAVRAHVDDNGFVDFAGAGRDSAFIRYVASLSDVRPSRLASPRDELAFWINAYNALTIKLVSDNLPLNSITDIAGGLTGAVVPGVKSPWELRVATIEGRDVTLQEIEDDHVRHLGDERVHFAINCASISCPKLQRTAFSAANVDELLNRGRAEFLADRRHNYLRGGRLYCSKIFDWYRSDFEKAGGSLQGYLARYWPDATEATIISHLSDDQIEFLDYNWKLVSQDTRHR